jgi:hypothetical protein
VRVVHSGPVGADLFAIGCRSDGAGRDDGVDATVTSRGTVATSRPPSAHSASWSPSTHSAGTAGIVLETGIGVGESAGARRIAAVKCGIAAQPSTQHQIVGGGQRQEDFGCDDQHLQVEGPSSTQAVR